jgi:hypothetical protein
MRTGVLKSREVADVLTEKYVCSWKNIDGEPTCGSSFAHEPSDKPGACMTGDGEHNTQLCVFTADGRLLTVMAGYQMPCDLKAELEWAWEKARPIAVNERLSEEQKKDALVKLFEKRMGGRQNHNNSIDQKYMTKHALDPWTQFNIKDLVDGRGFGDHFFGRYDKQQPGEGIGDVPEYREKSIHQVRMEEIKVEARRLNQQYALAGERRRRELKEKLVELDAEYKELQAKCAAPAGKVREAKPAPDPEEPVAAK